MIIICVDGATPFFARDLRLCTFAKSPALGRPAIPLKSVYPASTAPAHASMMTGTFPEKHGIVANRFWDNSAGNVLSLAKGDPIATLHPYEHGSLTARSLLHSLLGRGMRIAAVQFPHTFSRSWGPDRVDTLKSVYCVYHPSRTYVIPRGENGEWLVLFREMGFHIEVVFKSVGHTLPHINPTDWQITPITAGTQVEIHEDSIDVFVHQGAKAASFALRILGSDGNTLSVYRSTAVIAMCCGDLAPGELVRAECLPHSPQIDYTGNPNHAFHESPNISWVTHTALALLEDEPDVLFVRYPQVDHAQEFLYWHTTRGTAARQRESLDQIRSVYRAVHDGILAIMSAAGWHTPSFVFSDHGITHVDRHVHLNQLLKEVDLDREFVFQGDSTCAYLYGDRSILQAEVRRLREGLEAYPARSRIAGWGELRSLHAFHAERCGQLSVLCEPHTEFQYGPGEVVAEVCSASHGCSPELPSMNGVWIPLAGDRVLNSSPQCLTDLARIIENCAIE